MSILPADPESTNLGELPAFIFPTLGVDPEQVEEILLRTQPNSQNLVYYFRAMTHEINSSGSRVVSVRLLATLMRGLHEIIDIPFVEGIAFHRGLRRELRPHSEALWAIVRCQDILSEMSVRLNSAVIKELIAPNPACEEGTSLAVTRADFRRNMIKIQDSLFAATSAFRSHRFKLYTQYLREALRILDIMGRDYVRIYKVFGQKKDPASVGMCQMALDVEVDTDWMRERQKNLNPGNLG